MRYLLVALAFWGCGFVQKRVNIANCEFSLQSASLKNVDLSGFSLRVVLKARNPNSIDAVLDRLQGSVLMNKVKIADVNNSQKRTIKANSSTNIPLDVSVKFSNLKGASDQIRKVISSRRAEVGFVGKAYVDYDIPLVGKKSFSYPVKVSRTLSL